MANRFRCYACKHPLGEVSRMRDGRRRLKLTEGVMTGFRESGELDIWCASCETPNRFTWHTQRARLPTSEDSDLGRAAAHGSSAEPV